MRSFVPIEPHLSTMPRIDDWCDEATFVDWEQNSPELPDWRSSFEHLVADGQVSTLKSPSEANATRSFPPPVDAR